MKQRITFAILSLFIFQAFILLPVLHAESLSDLKTEQLEEAAEVDTHTLAPPLIGSISNPVSGTERSLSLLDPAKEPGYWGELLYEMVGEKSFRLQSRDLKDAAGFFWLFQKPMDLRDRWVEIIYSGISVPSQVLLNIDSRMPRTDAGFIVPLDNSFNPKSSYFKLPARTPFSKIQKLSFSFDPKFGKDIEMILLDLKVMPEGFDPLQTNESASYAN